MTAYEVQHGKYTISADPNRLDMDVIHTFLANESYWGQARSRALNEQLVKTCLCFGVYDGENQIGFARILTDYGIIAYVADVFILDAYRGQGLGKALMASIMHHPALRDLPQWLLGTKDAHSLYEKFGFAPLGKPEMVMSIGFASGQMPEFKDDSTAES